MKKTVILEGRLTYRHEKSAQGGTEDRYYLNGEKIEFALEEAAASWSRVDKYDDIDEFSAGTVRLTIKNEER